MGGRMEGEKGRRVEDEKIRVRFKDAWGRWDRFFGQFLNRQLLIVNC